MMRCCNLLSVALVGATVSGCSLTSPGTILPPLEPASSATLLEPDERQRHVEELLSIASEHRQRAGIATGALQERPAVSAKTSAATDAGSPL